MLLFYTECELYTVSLSCADTAGHLVLFELSAAQLKLRPVFALLYYLFTLKNEFIAFAR